MEVLSYQIEVYRRTDISKSDLMFILIKNIYFIANMSHFFHILVILSFQIKVDI